MVDQFDEDLKAVLDWGRKVLRPIFGGRARMQPGEAGGFLRAKYSLGMAALLPDAEVMPAGAGFSNIRKHRPFLRSTEFRRALGTPIGRRPAATQFPELRRCLRGHSRGVDSVAEGGRVERICRAGLPGTASLAYCRAARFPSRSSVVNRDSVPALCSHALCKASQAENSTLSNSLAHYRSRIFRRTPDLGAAQERNDPVPSIDVRIAA